MSTAANENESRLIYMHCISLSLDVDFAKIDISTSDRQSEQPFWSLHFDDLLQKRSDSDGWTVEIRLLFWFFLFLPQNCIQGSSTLIIIDR